MYTSNDVSLAIQYAEDIHRHEVRKHSGLPYMSHVFDVLKMVSDIGVTDKKTVDRCHLARHN